MRFALRPFIAFVTTAIVASQTFAAAASSTSTSTSNSTSTSATQEPKKEQSIVSGFIDLNRSTSLIDHQDGTRQDAMNYAARVNFLLGAGYVLRFDGGYTQDLNDSERADFSDTVMALVKLPKDVGNWFKIGYSASASAPTSKDSSIRQSLQTAVKTGMIIVVNPDRLKTGFGIVATINAGKNFHRYETDVNGAVNNSYSSAQALSLSYDIGKFSFSADFSHMNAWSYQNNMKDAFEFSQELGFQATKRFYLAVGHTNNGSSLRPNGVDSNVQLWNENTSIVYASLKTLF